MSIDYWLQHSLNSRLVVSELSVAIDPYLFRAKIVL